jgi:hypothetical protein
LTYLTFLYHSHFVEYQAHFGHNKTVTTIQKPTRFPNKTYSFEFVTPSNHSTFCASKDINHEAETQQESESDLRWKAKKKKPSLKMNLSEDSSEAKESPTPVWPTIVPTTSNQHPLNHYLTMKAFPTMRKSHDARYLRSNFTVDVIQHYLDPKYNHEFYLSVYQKDFSVMQAEC